MEFVTAWPDNLIGTDSFSIHSLAWLVERDSTVESLWSPPTTMTWPSLSSVDGTNAQPWNLLGWFISGPSDHWWLSSMLKNLVDFELYNSNKWLIFNQKKRCLTNKLKTCFPENSSIYFYFNFFYLPFHPTILPSVLHEMS